MDDVLEYLGLTRAEQEVYLALLRLGPSSVTPIKKQIRISASKLYEYLEKLARKGLVTPVQTERQRIYQAADPEALT